MKRPISIVALMVALSLSAAPVSAGAKKKARAGRGVATGEYTMPGGAWVFHSDAGVAVVSADCEGGRGCVWFEIPEGAQSVSLTVADKSGQSPAALISGVTEEGALVTCDSDTGPLPIEDFAAAQEAGDYDPETDGPPRIVVTLNSGLCADGSPGIATSGTVTATFTGTAAE